MDADQPVERVVGEGRRRTGKPPTPKDEQLVQYLKEQEVLKAADFFALTPESFDLVTRHPAMTLVMADALRELRKEHSQTAHARAGKRMPSDNARSSHNAQDRLCTVLISEYVGTITMTHNAKRNALGVKLCSEIGSGLSRCCAAGVRAIILRALPGVSVWSAGHDMREFGRANNGPGETGDGKFNDPLSRNDPFVQLLHEIRQCPVPVIAAVEGGVWGGACDIITCCDVVIGTPESTFCITPAKIGLPYHASGMTHFLGVLPLHVIKWMFFSSSVLTGQEAMQYGFLNACVPPEQAIEPDSTACTKFSPQGPRTSPNCHSLQLRLRKWRTRSPHALPSWLNCSKRTSTHYLR